MALISLIYKHLKTHGRSTLAEITAGTHGIPGGVRDILDIEIARGYIKEDTTTTPYQYEIKIILGPLTSKDKIAPLWKHKEIIQRVEAPEKASVIHPTVVVTFGAVSAKSVILEPL